MQVFLKQPLQLTARHGDVHRQLIEVDGFFEVGLHQRHDFLQLGLVGAEHVLKRHALMVLLVTNALVHKHF